MSNEHEHHKHHPHHSHEKPEEPVYANANDLPRAVREEMKELSKKVFGSTSKWKTLLDNGVMVRVTKDGKDKDGKDTQVDQGYSVKRYLTFNQLKNEMVEALAKKAAMNEALVKQQMEASKRMAEKIEAEEVQKIAGGSAI